MPASPNPSTNITNLRPDLMGLFTPFDVDANNQKMIGLQIFRPLSTALQAGPFGKVTIASLLKQTDTKRGSGGGYNSADFDFTTDTYSTKENGIEVPVDRRQAAIYKNYFDAEALAARLSRSKVMVNLEMRCAAKLFDTGTFTTTAVTAGAWSVAATSKPITDVENAVQRLYDSGIIANALVVSWKNFRRLRNCQQIIDRINSAGAGNPSKPSDVTPSMLSACFDLPKIIVGGSQKNSAIEGQTASLASIWSDSYAAVTRVAESDNIEDPCIGRTFHWDEDGGDIGGAIETYYSNEKRGDVARCRMDTDEHVMYTDAAQLISGL